MTEIIRLIGYGLFACGILVILWEVLVWFVEQEEQD